MLSVLSSFAQEESKNVSDNIKWRIREKFEQGEVVINATRFLGYDKDEVGNLIVNPMEAKIVKRIFEEYICGKGAFTIAKELNVEGISTVTSGRWHESTILYILQNEKYKGAALLQKYYINDHISKRKVRNTGELNSYYIEDNHPAIVSEGIWNGVQQEIRRRAEAKGNFSGEKYQNRYPLTGMLYCSICGSPLRRRTWNSKQPCRKIVWQCSNYIKNGKNACSGTSIDDEIIGGLNIQEDIIVKESIENGKKHYSYTSKGKQDQPSREHGTTKEKNGSIL